MFQYYRAHVCSFLLKIETQTKSMTGKWIEETKSRRRAQYLEARNDIRLPTTVKSKRHNDNVNTL